MNRKYSNPTEGSLEHDGIIYKEPESDEHWIQVLLRGELLFADEIFEVWVLDGYAVITVNEVEELFS